MGLFEMSFANADHKIRFCHTVKENFLTREIWRTSGNGFSAGIKTCGGGVPICQEPVSSSFWFGDVEMVGSTEQARHWYAEELRFTAKVGSRAVIDAFATVPRELFFGPGPWRILSPMAASDYWTTEDANPRHLYHDVLVAIDEQRRLNNGQPSLWARLYDQLELTRGLHIVHIGAGSGYYSAILAEIVGPGGHVVAIEIDPELATRARLNLAAAWPHATVIVGNGFAFRPDRPADVIVVNAGVNNISMAWLDALAAENGRVFVPLTTANGGVVP